MTNNDSTMNNLEEQVVNTVDQQLSATLTHTGQVKWFNNRLGYGFIKIISGDNAEDDIFVHQTHISPLTSEYRSLSTGEYVSFNISDSDGNRQAVDVSGVNGGPLLVDNPSRQRPYRDNTRNSRPRTDQSSQQ